MSQQHFIFKIICFKGVTNSHMIYGLSSSSLSCHFSRNFAGSKTKTPHRIRRLSGSVLTLSAATLAFIRKQLNMRRYRLDVLLLRHLQHSVEQNIDTLPKNSISWNTETCRWTLPQTTSIRFTSLDLYFNITPFLRQCHRRSLHCDVLPYEVT